jgi:hypothetical protein
MVVVGSSKDVVVVGGSVVVVVVVVVAGVDVVVVVERWVVVVERWVVVVVGCGWRGFVVVVTAGCVVEVDVVGIGIGIKGRTIEGDVTGVVVGAAFDELAVPTLDMVGEIAATVSVAGDVRMVGPTTECWCEFDERVDVTVWPDDCVVGVGGANTGSWLTALGDVDVVPWCADMEGPGPPSRLPTTRNATTVRTTTPPKANHSGSRLLRYLAIPMVYPFWSVLPYWALPTESELRKWPLNWT